MSMVPTGNRDEPPAVFKTLLNTLRRTSLHQSMSANWGHGSDLPNVSRPFSSFGPPVYDSPKVRTYGSRFVWGSLPHSVGERKPRTAQSHRKFQQSARAITRVATACGQPCEGSRGPTRTGIPLGDGPNRAGRTIRRSCHLRPDPIFVGAARA